MRERRSSLLLLLVAVLLMVGCFLVAGNGAYGGTDGKATDAITASDPSYRPWFTHLWAPQSKEVEGGLFALQAALGGGVVGFALGALRERRKGRERAATRAGSERAADTDDETPEAVAADGAGRD